MRPDPHFPTTRKTRKKATHAMSRKKPPSDQNQDQKPETGQEGQPAEEARTDPLEQWLNECAEDALVFHSKDDEFMKIFNAALDQILPPGGGIDLEEWGRDGPHRMH